MTKLFRCAECKCCLSPTDAGLLLLRLMVGGFMLTHGIPKLMNFEALSQTFPPMLGLSSPVALGLIVFAEVFASIALILGLLTRLATLPLMIGMGVAAFVAHGADPFAAKEMALMYFVIYIVLALTGPGKIAIDRWIYLRFCPSAKQAKTCSTSDSAA